MRAISAPSVFVASQHSQQLRRRHIIEHPRANPRKGVDFKDAQIFVSVARRPRCRKLTVPFTRNSLEAGRRPMRGNQLVNFAHLAWINTVPELLPCLLAQLSRLLKRNVRVSPKRQRFAFIGKTVIHAPILPALGINKQIHAITIGQLVEFFPR